MVVKLSDFNDQFRTRLYRQIQEIEKQTLAEVVVIIRASSGHYRDVALWSGFIFQILVTLFLLFSPFVFSPYTISFSSLLAFILGYLTVQAIPPLKRQLVSNKRKQKTVEIYARAIFQKGKIHYTREHTGLLIFISVFERKVFLVPDIGLTQAIPEHLWKDIEQKFNNIFNGDDFATEALMRELTELKMLLNKYVPPVEDDINEIPDDLKVDL